MFRDKTAGIWGTHIETFYFDKGKKIKSTEHTKLFYCNLALRNSCYQCKYAKKERIGDFTIGDAWGCKNQNPEFYNIKGVSIILINTEKGKQLFYRLKESIKLHKIKLNNYLQGPLCKPATANRSIDEFWNDYQNKNFSYIIKKYARNNIFLNWKYILRKLVK